MKVLAYLILIKDDKEHRSDDVVYDSVYKIDELIKPNIPRSINFNELIGNVSNISLCESYGTDHIPYIEDIANYTLTSYRKCFRSLYT